MKKPFQGVGNIVRFNWHFYVLAFGLVLIGYLVGIQFEKPISTLIFTMIGAACVSVFVSLLASWYVYDRSNLYSLHWMEPNQKEISVVNINAGFDETSTLLQEKFRGAELTVLDFYNPETHTEVSIQRARKAYPPFAGTRQITTADIGLPDQSADTICLILAAHEIRKGEERTRFFMELHRILKPDGCIYVTEHLRDVPNFLVYNLGFFHFHSRASWLKNFSEARFEIRKEIKITPFISTFILQKNGNSL